MDRQSGLLALGLALVAANAITSGMQASMWGAVKSNKTTGGGLGSALSGVVNGVGGVAERTGKLAQDPFIIFHPWDDPTWNQ